MKPIAPSKLEMQVLSVLWERGPAPVRAVLEAMPDGKTRAYTTVLSVLQVMGKKGLVSHTTQGNTHIYEARVTREQVTGPLLRTLVRDVFGGSAVSALQHLLGQTEVTPEEMSEIKRLLAGYDRPAGAKPAAPARRDR
jgi:predicted transcriptional regulator